MGRKVDKACSCCLRRTKKRRHDNCPVCGGKLRARVLVKKPAKREGG